MSEENTTEEKTPEQSFAELRAQKEALESELRPLKVERAVRDAGFDPSTPEGKALSRLADIEADGEKVKALAEELGFEASKPAPSLNVNETVAATLAARGAEIASVTTSDNPATTVNDEISEVQAALNAARAAKNWDEAKALGQQLTRLNSQKMFAQVMSHE